MTVATPQQIEARLVQLGKELDDAHDALVQAEQGYYDAKAGYEVGIARSRLQVGERYAAKGIKVTVQEREDEALMAVADQLRALYSAEAIVRAVRANVTRIKTHIDIARSVGTSVRASMEL